MESTIPSLSVTLEKFGSAELSIDADRRGRRKGCNRHVGLHAVVRWKGKRGERSHRGRQEQMAGCRSVRMYSRACGRVSA